MVPPEIGWLANFYNLNLLYCIVLKEVYDIWGIKLYNGGEMVYQGCNR